VVFLANHNNFVFGQILTRPSAANKNFPYHVRTSQVSIISRPQHSRGGGEEGEEKICNSSNDEEMTVVTATVKDKEDFVFVRWEGGS